MADVFCRHDGGIMVMKEDLVLVSKGICETWGEEEGGGEEEERRGERGEEERRRGGPGEKTHFRFHLF